MSRELRMLLDHISSLSPATREFNPGIGEGKLNRLIELGQLVANQQSYEKAVGAAKSEIHFFREANQRQCDRIRELEAKVGILEYALERLQEDALDPGVQIHAEDALAEAKKVGVPTEK